MKLPVSVTLRRAVVRGLAGACLGSLAWGVAIAQSVQQAPATAATAARAPAQADNAQWQMQTIPTRVATDGKAITLSLAMRASDTVAPRHVLLHFSSTRSTLLRESQGRVTPVSSALWVRAVREFNARGVVVALADAPSDLEQRALGSRAPSDIAADIQAAFEHLRQRYPGVPVHLAGFGVDGKAFLNAASKLASPGLGRLLIASGDFRRARGENWNGLVDKRPVLLLHAPSAQCDATPFLEALHVAEKNRFALLRVGYAQPEAKPGCGAGSQHVFTRLDVSLADAITRWLDGAEPPATVGHATPDIAWREQTMFYDAPATLGTHKLEMTLLLPPGAGPFPVLVFNHGDVELGSSYLSEKMRMVDMLLAREFLQLGWAVAFPARLGVGLSEGHHKLYRSSDADATYKAREHTQVILPALDALKRVALLDMQRVVIAGQSAGGYAAMYVASQNLPGVVGAVDFSGGRTDLGSNSSGPGYLNEMMVRGFAEMGRSTRAPTLWIFAENDSRYTANTIRASHQAYVEAGGKATLVLTPAIEGDGHFVYHKPELWREKLREYLVALPARQPP